MQISKNIGKAVRFYRKKRGLNQYELADLINSNQSYISQVETGKKIPSIDMLEEIAKALSVDIYDLLLPVEMSEGTKRAIKLMIGREKGFIQNFE